MFLIGFIVSLAGATMLLLYSVNMVQTGIDRSFGSAFRRIVTQNTNLLRATFVGGMLAVVLQSSAAVVALVTEFALLGSIKTSVGLAVALGADLGSALVVHILSLQMDWLISVFLASGGLLFLKAKRKQPVQAGRILLGLGFILLSLRLLREMMEPIRDSNFLPIVSDYLSSDPLTSFILGAGLAFVMHSSVAVILMCVTVVTISAIPFDVGVVLVLGANMGSALIPLWLTRSKPLVDLHIPIANLLLRGTLAICALAIYSIPFMSALVNEDPSATRLVLLHIGFNAFLLIFVPLSRGITTLVERLVMKNPSTPHDELMTRSALTTDSSQTPALVVATLRREVLRMGQLAELAIRPVMYHYETGDLNAIMEAKKLDLLINEGLSGVRKFVIDLDEQKLSKTERSEVQNLTEYAINLETAGDIVAKRLLPLAEVKVQHDLHFSPEGWREITKLHEQALTNAALALNVLVTESIDSARMLIDEKAEFASRERDSRRQHLKRVQLGAKISLESSDLHLETLRGLKDFNSQMLSIAYPILYREGQLLDSRLTAIAES